MVALSFFDSSTKAPRRQRDAALVAVGDASDTLKTAQAEQAARISALLANARRPMPNTVQPKRDGCEKPIVHGRKRPACSGNWNGRKPNKHATEEHYRTSSRRFTPNSELRTSERANDSAQHV
jgi:hypothetical protein